jgi:hypothetical protein
LTFNIDYVKLSSAKGADMDLQQKENELRSLIEDWAGKQTDDGGKRLVVDAQLNLTVIDLVTITFGPTPDKNTDWERILAGLQQKRDARYLALLMYFRGKEDIAIPRGEVFEAHPCFTEKKSINPCTLAWELNKRFRKGEFGDAVKHWRFRQNSKSRVYTMTLAIRS